MIQVFIAALAVTLASPAERVSVHDLHWMSGHWRSESETRTVEEIWSAPEGGMLLGVHREISSRGSSFEFLRIAETEQGLVYFASPGGRPATPFRATEVRDRYVRFENLEHDFPVRIIYWLEEGSLCARAEGPDGNGPQWCWPPAN